MIRVASHWLLYRHSATRQWVGFPLTRMLTTPLARSAAMKRSMVRVSATNEYTVRTWAKAWDRRDRLYGSAQLHFTTLIIS